MKLPRTFFEKDTQTVAKSLLGMLLQTSNDEGTTIGRIVETEAYLPTHDSACHAAKHRTPRTEVMFGPAGIAYVYPIHAKFCFNVVTETVGVGCAVLIRALEPLDGIPLMQKRRNNNDRHRLTTGPARLCQALGINRTHNGIDLTNTPNISLNSSTPPRHDEIVKTVRIGVTSAKRRKLRYAIRGNPFVSGPKYMRE